MNIKRLFAVLACPFFFVLLAGNESCGGGQERMDRKVVDDQQAHYAKVQPIPFFDYSMPRDVLIQIYKATVSGNRSTYTVVTAITGELLFECPSVGLAIPVDTQLTNPLKPAYEDNRQSGIIEQPEPNGLFSSKNTDGTFVLCVDFDGSLAPVYTEQKVTTFPFAVKKTANGWVRADQRPASTIVEISKGR
ncbi:hypothetical protein IPJ70_02590 [Candidatus Campbellbacteria bacterium]|nr:MAG: hypothetical protein IPJ70_02590 [Candidatus Campbellbacteria bacterium]